MKLLRLLFIFLSVPLFAQQGGMWIPSLLEGMNESEMTNLGMKMTAKDIYDVNNASLKDAVPHFNGGCTSEVISNQGLLLTNHHCGYSQIQSHSSLENDYLQDGFWAMSLKEELPNPGVTASFMVRIEDVTTQVMNGLTAAMSETEKQKKIEENIAKVVQTSPKEAWQENRVRTFYEGNQYMLFVVETYKDVRLVGAPPSSIGKFGSDTDNWIWPRHTGDFSLFRIYADKNNRPAEYSEDNVPYTPKHFLPISLDGVAENDFTLVFGYPGATDEYLPSIAIEQVINTVNPARIAIRDAALAIQDKYMRADPQIKIQYASKFARIANYWKKWKGETLGLTKSNAIGIKKQQEKELISQINKKGKQQEYGQLLPKFEQYYTEIEPYILAREYYLETVMRNVELLRTAYQAYQLKQVYENRGAQSFQDRRNNMVERLEGQYKDYSSQVDKEVFEALIALYAEGVPEQFLPASFKSFNPQQLTNDVYNNSAFVDYASVKNLLEGDAETVIAKLNNDPGFKVVQQMADTYFDKVAPKYEELELNISGLQRDYMKALLELSPKDARIFPNANSTLRVTYGKVAGYSPADAIYYEPVTHLEGVMQKYVPGDYEFDVPQKLIDLYEAKDYGQYGENGKMPINFIGTNHTTGGNSGSPAIDAHGNLIGLNFDRVWEGTMSDYYYDPALSRNIMVDIRYVLFIMDKYAGAKNLIDELKLVHPKKEKVKSKKKK
ncbi:S46 family peptidase [Aequorivita lipolytica]|uniref:Dipeptidyl-peptidase n=1 Tax=Aequorivita lipolytica TaxID=153267 RepID=A0A5C6YPJ4_9FLAO|nr:S46 family peptidase [Aequorivita lipolytica]TXD68946.1 S46 family peptidase [Aequorivita lipolytica]SRX53082.1 Asp/Glu-specific dipeptidyl-peptidase [Aequorivita lipolytica]